jgi:hypothetical protein
MSKKRWSASQSESKPSSSARRATDDKVSKVSGDSPGNEKSNCGSARPMRI